MKTIDRLVFFAVDVALVLLLAAMCAMVFGNVVLRYGFGSGIDVSDEMSRFCFVWLIFLGSISAMRRNLHMGFDMFILQAGPRLRRLLLATANLLILGCCILLLAGTWMQWDVNATNLAPVTGLAMSWLYGILVPMSLSVGAIAAWRVFGYASGRIDDHPRPAGGLHE